MPTCTRCGTKYGFGADGRGICKQCQPLHQRELAEARFAESGSIINQEAPPHILDERAKAIVLTTGSDVPHREIEEVIDIIGSEVAIGMNFLQDITNTWVDTIGGRSNPIQGTLRKAREAAMAELRREALLLEADAVIAVKLDYSQATTSMGGVLFVVATGTAVRLAA